MLTPTMYHATVMLTVVHVAMVHIVVHALPEAALFVIVGSVLHTVGSQDGRTMASAGHDVLTAVS